jgi:hypothetical protein
MFALATLQDNQNPQVVVISSATEKVFGSPTMLNQVEVDVHDRRPH